MPTARFFSALPVLTSKDALCEFGQYAPVPEDWYVAVADVRGSTQAIEDGRYKDVNMVASCTIVAVLNRVPHDDVAYIFGGDGATLIFSPKILHDVCVALLSAQVMAQTGFGLDLRVGVVPVAQLLAAGATLSVAKVAVSAAAHQSAFSGNGVSIAEKWVKDDSLNGAFKLQSYLTLEDIDRGTQPDDFAGLQCRWQPLTSRNGVSLSVMIQARHGDAAAEEALYREILGRIVGLCGEPLSWRPASQQNMKLTLNARRMRTELLTRTAAYSLWRKGLTFLVMYIGTCIARVAMALGFKIGRFDGRVYAENAALHSDFIKFDNTLRMVMDVTPAQQQQIESLLDQYEHGGQVFYGTFASDAALMTCMVFDPNSDHFHFIDGDKGGYSLAAKSMKEKMKAALN